MVGITLFILYFSHITFRNCQKYNTKNFRVYFLLLSNLTEVGQDFTWHHYSSFNFIILNRLRFFYIIFGFRIPIHFEKFWTVWGCITLTKKAFDLIVAYYRLFNYLGSLNLFLWVRDLHRDSDAYNSQSAIAPHKYNNTQWSLSHDGKSTFLILYPTSRGYYRWHIE